MVAASCSGLSHLSVESPPHGTIPLSNPLLKDMSVCLEASDFFLEDGVSPLGTAEGKQQHL